MPVILILFNARQGRPHKFLGGQTRPFSCLFHVVNDAIQMDVTKTLQSFYPTEKMLYVTETVIIHALR